MDGEAMADCLSPNLALSERRRDLTISTTFRRKQQRLILGCPLSARISRFDSYFGLEERLSQLNPAEPVSVWRVMSPTSYQAAPPRVMDITRLADLLQPRSRRPLTGVTCAHFVLLQGMRRQAGAAFGVRTYVFGRANAACPKW
jgi:hypothetical protein